MDSVVDFTEHERTGLKLVAHGEWLLIRGGSISRCSCSWFHCIDNILLWFLLQIVVSGVADSVSDVAAYASCTLLAASLDTTTDTTADQTQDMITACIQFLQDNEFVCLQTVKSTGLFTLQNLYWILIPNADRHFIVQDMQQNMLFYSKVLNVIFGGILYSVFFSVDLNFLICGLKGMPMISLK